jgi:hypothetical protein
MLVKWLIIQPCRWRRHVPSKDPSTLNGLQCIVSQKTELFIATAVRISTPKRPLNILVRYRNQLRRYAARAGRFKTHCTYITGNTLHHGKRNTPFQCHPNAEFSCYLAYYYTGIQYEGTDILRKQLTSTSNLQNILSRVQESVINNNGLRIEWFDLLALLLKSLSITINLQQLTINLQPAAEPLTVEDSLHSLSRSTGDFCSVDFLLDNSSARTTRKTLFFCCPKMRVYWSVT